MAFLLTEEKIRKAQGKWAEEHATLGEHPPTTFDYVAKAQLKAISLKLWEPCSCYEGAGPCLNCLLDRAGKLKAEAV